MIALATVRCSRGVVSVGKSSVMVSRVVTPSMPDRRRSGRRHVLKTHSFVTINRPTEQAFAT
jgi:hypothetical protein